MNAEKLAIIFVVWGMVIVTAILVTQGVLFMTGNS